MGNSWTIIVGIIVLIVIRVVVVFDRTTAPVIIGLIILAVIVG